MYTADVFPTVGIRGTLDIICIYFYHPSGQLDLQGPSLALTPTNTYTPLDLINNQYLTGITSSDSTTYIAFSFYVHLPDCRRHDILHLRMLKLDDMQAQVHNTNSASLPNIATVISLTCPPHHADYDDEPIRSNTLLTNPYVPYPHIITIFTHAQPTYGLIMVASRRVIWTASIPKEILPTNLP
jgi:hypothetical protein